MILYTSDIEKYSCKISKCLVTYLLITFFCALFGAVYEHFSHGVYSYYMIYAFMFPLVGGALPLGFLNVRKQTFRTNLFTRNFYHAGIATLTVGSIVSGIFEIYGTTNKLIGYYWCIGILLLVIALISFFIKK